MSSPPPTIGTSRSSTGSIRSLSEGDANKLDRREEGLRARKRTETRERLFETALREFREVGVGASQIDRIARAAGVARGTFYFHFATKDDVLIELARRISARVARRVAVLDESNPSLGDLLRRVNDAILDEHSRVGEADLLGEMLSLYVRRPYDVQDPSQNIPSLADELARHLRDAVDRGELKSDLPPEQVALVLMTSLFGIYTRIPPGEELQRTCEALIELLVRGLSGPT
jgi:AcrR family transcriptional regulator